jgi:hypothetical protein
VLPFPPIIVKARWVPTISGYQQGLRRVPPDAVTALEQLFDDDERAQFRGEPPRRQLLVGDDPWVPASYRSRDAISFYLQPKADRTAEANHKMPVSPALQGAGRRHARLR